MGRSPRLTLCGDRLAALKPSVLETEVESLGVRLGEAFHDHSGVGVEDTVHRETASLDGHFVHFYFAFFINNYKLITHGRNSVNSGSRC